MAEQPWTAQHDLSWRIQIESKPGDGAWWERRRTGLVLVLCNCGYSSGWIPRDQAPTREELQREHGSAGDDPQVQCWHIEPGTPCDWDICRQPERLAAGDIGTDPAHAPTPARLQTLLNDYRSTR